MGKSVASGNEEDDEKCVFPLTGLQIGDLQSYLSDLSLFVALASNKFYILVDNRPWLVDLGSRPEHLWQLMVTKSRLSPFANSKAQRGRKDRKDACSRPNPNKTKKFDRWFSLIDAATLSRKTRLPPVKKLRNSLFLSSELHRTLSGFIVFEVAWTNVRGINYLNELQTDTSLAIETKVLQRWEFDSIEQASTTLSSWFSGAHSDQLRLKEYLDSTIGEIFYDAEESFSKNLSIDGSDDNKICSDNPLVEDKPAGSIFSVYPGTIENEASEPHTPPPTGPYKRRRVTKSSGNGSEVDFYSEEMWSRIPDSLCNSENTADDCENAVESKQYWDVLILIRFDERDLPFKLRQIVVSDLRLLTLLEAGLPSWVIFLQSYPGFCHIYRPWMCPLARALYVLISVVTVLIGFYDLYKNVPLLKATASRLFGPLFDWIETWEMVTRIKYLGTMLFLHNSQKAITWFLTMSRTARSFLSVFTKPLLGPLMEFIGYLLPMWNMAIEVLESLSSLVWVVIESSYSAVGDLIEFVLWPIWVFFTVIWSIVTTVFYPLFWILWEVLYAPIRVVFASGSLVASMYSWLSELIGDIWRSLSSIFKLASASHATMSSYEVSMWRSLWNDLFSQVFRALRSILNGFVAFFAACNRHRLSIYNHAQDFIRRILGRPPILRASESISIRRASESKSIRRASESMRRKHKNSH